MDSASLPSADPTAMMQTVPPEAIAAGGPFILWIFFWFAFIVTAGFAFALFYHWIRWGFMYPLAFIATPVYGVGVLVLLGAMLAGIGSL
ncbi:hypothetical protein K2X83_01990 [Patescibacteria group bacterium]|nr:hypothetical protein [Patescibacteria group bacterium]